MRCALRWLILYAFYCDKHVSLVWLTIISNLIQTGNEMVVGNDWLRSLRFFGILSDLNTCLGIRAEAIPTLAVVNKNDLVSNHS